MTTDQTTQGQTVVPATLARYDAATRSVEAMRRQSGGPGRFLRPGGAATDSYFIRVAGNEEDGYAWESDLLYWWSISGNAQIAALSAQAISATKYIVIKCVWVSGVRTLTVEPVDTVVVFASSGTAPTLTYTWHVPLAKIDFTDPANPVVTPMRSNNVHVKDCLLAWR